MNDIGSLKFVGLRHSDLRGAADAVARSVVTDEGVGLRQRVERVHRPDAVLVGLPAPTQPNAISANDDGGSSQELASLEVARTKPCRGSCRTAPKAQSARAFVSPAG